MEHQSFDWNAKLVRFFVANSRLVWLIIIGLLVGGWLSLVGLRREGFPQVSPKIIMVQTIYPGATAQEVESQVTREIETAVKDVRGLKETSSTSQNSFSNVVVQLDEAVDIDTAIQDVQTHVQAVRAALPEGAEQPKIVTFSTGGPSILIGLTKREAYIEDLRSQINKLVDRLADLDGVKSAELLSDRERRAVIRYRLDDLTKHGVSPGTLGQIIQATNVNMPVGTLTTGDQEQSIVTVGAYQSIKDIKSVTVGVNPQTGQTVTLKDIAEVAIEPTEQTLVERFGLRRNNHVAIVPGLIMAITATTDADIVLLRDRVIEQIAQAKQEQVIDQNVEYELLQDQAQMTTEQISEIAEAAVGAQRNFWLLGGLQLLFLAILLFVNVRAAIVAALSIPFSLGFTFIILALLGVQLNTIVLFSLILVLGLIVDPAIVMVEAIQRYRDIHYKGREAVLESGRRYGASLFMAVLTSLIVFFPFGVVSGMFGQIIKYIPLTVIPALLASYFVPMALLPLLTERFLKTKPSKTQTRRQEDEGLSRGARAIMAMNRFVLARPSRHIVVLILAFTLVGAAVSLVPTGKVQVVQFSKPKDNEWINITAEFMKGLSFEKRAAIAMSIETIVQQEPGVKNFYYFDQRRDGVIMQVTLKKKHDRPSERDASEQITARISEKVAQVEGLADTSVAESGIGPPESIYPIQTQLYAADQTVLESAAKTVGNFLANLEHVTKVDDGFTNRAEPKLEIILDRQKVQQLGLSNVEVSQQLKGILDETKIARYEDASLGETIDIVLVSQTKPGDIEALKVLSLSSRTGQSFFLKDIATLKETASIDAIQRFNGSRFVNVRAKVDDPKNTLAVQQKIDQFLTDTKLKELGLDSRQNRGEFEEIAKSFQELGIALVIAVFLTYIVLVLQFRSFSLPGIMLFTIPLSFVGVFPILWLTQSDLGFLELLGVTILVGIVENVAIFLIDYANQLMQEEKLSPKEAIIRASGVRFRPILLTKLVALGGLLPLAIESDFWRGLSVVIIAGIGVSGFLSLIVIPILYVWIGGLRAKIHKTHTT